MIRSMTGYGEAERDTAAGRLRAEVRTVNHRYFSLNLRLGRGLDRFETQVRDALRAQLPRGHVNFSLRLEPVDGMAADGGVNLAVDEAKLLRYVQLLRGIRERLDLPGEVDLALLSRFVDLVVDEDDAEVPLPEPDDVRLVTEAAARATAGMRREEGQRLQQDLEERLAAIEAAMARIVEMAPQRLVAERDRMRRVVQDLLEGVPVDEDRIAREIAHMAERWDVSEELVRLRSHIELFRESMHVEAQEPVGKRLSFLVQEMNRETNTIGSKANDAAMEHQVIAIKDEIERLREQIENVE
ncbi:MAG TPA: YicC/YloC family endoribonuclease [Longimicrobiales bacterium]|nr:YicC/YloC family endoribonuclease [Longimicrobiales bacterium]